MKTWFIASFAVAALGAQAQAADPLKAAVAADHRSVGNVARDVWRHPYETLSFFGIKPTDTVVELAPGGGWYTEILAPYLRDGGQLIAAEGGSVQALREKFAADAETYGKAQVLEFDPAAPVLGKPGSADVVLTFRNVHNWRMSNQAEGMFRAFFAVLKKGGTLGVVEHRADKDVPADDKSGYVSEAQVIALAKQAGFVFAGRSEINANGNDTKDYADGVWTLPPTYRLGDTDRAKYAAIGESDRMTLKFVKQ